MQIEGANHGYSLSKAFVYIAKIKVIDPFIIEEKQFMKKKPEPSWDSQKREKQ